VGGRTLVFLAPGLTSATSRTIQVGPGPASQMVAASRLDQSGSALQRVAESPAVRALDLDGNPVSNIQVNFQITAGGGSVSGSPVLTGSDGLARVGGWTLGSAGAQALQASSTGLSGSPITFTATAVSAESRYHITLRFLTEPPASQRQAFEQARARIEEIIVGDIPSVLVNYAATPACGNTPLGETIDDLLIFVEVGPIDGPGAVLGRAGPCLVRGSSRLPVVGHMQFDSDDLSYMEEQGILQPVILHEMMHVVGFGTIWQEAQINVLVGAGTADPYFTGSAARDAFSTFNGGAAYAGTPVPVENTGGVGTANAHWRESVLRSELMTGWVALGASPLSRTTVGSLGDIGYVVDPSKADAFSLASALRL